MIVVTGGQGLIGQELQKVLPQAKYLSSKDFNLIKESDVIAMYETLKPTIVIHLAAKVGGIIDNLNNPVAFFEENILMNTNIVKYAYKYNVKKLIGILSTCIFPDVNETYPLKEEDLHKGPPTESNFSYGYAKRCLAVQIDAYNKQYGTNYSYLIPTNLYGIYDKFDDKKSHFVSALIKKIHCAIKNKDDKIILYGDGSPIRQFMHSRDIANIIKICIEQNIYENMNISSMETYTIDQIARIALKVCDAEHLNIVYDKTKPNGQYRKDVSIDKMLNIIPDYKFITLEYGIKEVYDFLKITDYEE